MSGLRRLDEGARRAAEAVLRATGGRSALLRRARPGATNDVTEQLGLATATFDDVEMGPVLLRPLRGGGGGRFELLVSARAASATAGGAETAAVVAMLEAAAGVVLDGELLRIAGVSYRDMSGEPYVYRLELEAAAGAGL